MELSKLSKSSLEEILHELMEDLGKSNKTLEQKYQDIICTELYYIDDDEACKIVSRMKPYGQVFSMSSVTDLITKNGIHENKCVKYYLCMNMFYNDYKTYIDTHKLDPNEFCFEMSKLFINDVDAPKHKVEKYFKNFEES